MVIKQKTNREKEREKEYGKKRYLERLVEEEDANKQIDEFLKGKEDEDFPNES